MSDTRPLSRALGRPRWRPGRSAALLALAVVSLLLACALGSVNIPLGETLRAVGHGLSGQLSGGSDVIVWQLRLPRAALGFLVGASLAVCGGAYQGVFRNPLADPYLMGVASGAAFGATLALVSGWPAAWLPLCAMVGALASVFATLALARSGARFPVNRLILSGVVVGSVLTAAGTYLMLRGEDRTRQVLAYTLGNLAFSGWSAVLTVLPYALVGVGLLLLLARALNTLQLGDLTARSLGLPVERLRLIVVIASSLATAAAVSYAGIIGFVGLLTPHVVRRLWGGDHRVLLPVSALAGGTLLVLSDLLARTLTRPTELPVGVVTTLLGGPFFLYLLRRSKSE